MLAGHPLAFLNARPDIMVMQDAAECFLGNGYAVGDIASAQGVDGAERVVTEQGLEIPRKSCQTLQSSHVMLCRTLPSSYSTQLWYGIQCTAFFVAARLCGGVSFVRLVAQ